MLESLMIKYSEYDNLNHMIQQDSGPSRKKFKVCVVCQRLFANGEHLKRHEKESALHKESLEKIKFA
jgi:hypothetical protein